MEIEVGLTDFRGFHEQSYVPIRDITLLVGENSAGKTSLLAAIKYVHSLISGGVVAPDFNAEPFQLGTYEHIAHYRGGKAGRARRFGIKVRKKISKNNDSKKSDYVELKLTFGQQEIGAHLLNVEISAGTDSLNINSRPDFPEMELKIDGKTQEPTSESRMFRIGGNDISISASFMLRSLSLLLIDHRNEENLQKIKRFTDNVETLVSEFTKPMIATSAIRTKPLRTYTPGTNDEDGEGSHVPYELAKLARRKNKSEWNSIKKKIESFGQDSDMFNEIDVKSFGRTSSDPFQIQLSVRGPKRNIVDLGYGTSQVLPILYESSKLDENGNFLIQQPEVHLHPRAQAALGQFFINSVKSNMHSYVLETHSDFIIDRVRQAIQSQTMNTEQVSLLFFERSKLENTITRIKIDSNGDPKNPPKEYRDFFVDEQMRMLGL